MPTLMERQLDDVAGKLLQKSLEERGLKFLMGAQTQELVGGRRTAGSRRCSSRTAREIPADLVVMAVGIRPNTDAGREHAACTATRASWSTTRCRPSPTPRIYAVGECAAHRGIAYGLVAPLFEQGKVAANHLAQFGIGRYTGSLRPRPSSRSPASTCSRAGNFMGGEGTEEIVMSDP